MKRMMLAGLTVGMLAALGTAHAQTDALQARSWAAGCAACHGTNGRSPTGTDSLAGSDKEQLLKTLLAFKSGDKPAVVMHQIAKGYTDEQLAVIAGWFAAQKK